MSQATDYLENALIDHVFGGSTYSAPSNIYLGLFTAIPGDDASGAEVSAGNYARQEITFGSASNGASTSTNEITYTVSGANYGTVTHFGLFDASTSGNLLAYGNVSQPQNLTVGSEMTIPVGAVTIRLD